MTYRPLDQDLRADREQASRNSRPHIHGRIPTMATPPGLLVALESYCIMARRAHGSAIATMRN